MLDLLIILVANLPPAQSLALFEATASQAMLEHGDATVQKKGYRVLKRLLEAGRVGDLVQGEKLENFVSKLNEVGGGVGPGAQRVSSQLFSKASSLTTFQDRLQLLSVVVDILPKDQLHLIPELLSEAVLGTKEVNEKARDAGFDLILVMARKMGQGGSVKQPAGATDEEDMDGDGKWPDVGLNPAKASQILLRPMSRSTSPWLLPV